VFIGPPCICIFHLTWPMSLHYLVKSGCSKFLHNTGFVTIGLRREGILSRQLSCSEATARQSWLSGDDFLCFNRTAPWRISTWHSHFWLVHVTRKIVSEVTYRPNVLRGTLNSTIPIPSWCERNVSSSRRLCSFAGHVSSKNSDNFEPICHDNNSAK